VVTMVVMVSTPPPSPGAEPEIAGVVVPTVVVIVVGPVVDVVVDAEGPELVDNPLHVIGCTAVTVLVVVSVLEKDDARMAAATTIAATTIAIARRV